MKFRVGVYICSCGTNISDNIDIDELAEFSSVLDNVGYVKVHKLLCSEDGKNYLAEDIIKENPTGWLSLPAPRRNTRRPSVTFC